MHIIYPIEALKETSWCVPISSVDDDRQEKNGQQKSWIHSPIFSSEFSNEPATARERIEFPMAWEIPWDHQRTGKRLSVGYFYSGLPPPPPGGSHASCLSPWMGFDKPSSARDLGFQDPLFSFCWGMQAVEAAKVLIGHSFTLTVERDQP